MIVLNANRTTSLDFNIVANLEAKRSDLHTTTENQERGKQSIKPTLDYLE